MSEHTAYMRVSSDRQNEELQRPELERYAPAGTKFKEETGSAWKREDLKLRPVFAGIVRDIQRGRIRHLYVWDLDRIYRNRAKLKEFFELCKVHGCVVHSYRQPFLDSFETMNLPEGFGFIRDVMRDMLIQVLGWVAEDESKKKSDRSKLALRVKDGVTMSYKGKKWGRPELPPEAIARIRELLQSGASYRSINRAVSYRTADGKLKRPSIGKISELARSENETSIIYKETPEPEPVQK